MTKRRLQLPLVRRSSHIKAMRHAAHVSGKKFQDLQSELGQEIISLQADRDRLQAQAESARSRLKQLESQTNTLRPLADERNLFAQRVKDYEAECDRLGTVEQTLTEKLREQANLARHWEDQTTAYRTECERLGTAEHSLTEELREQANLASHWEGQTTAYRAECERLGAETIRLETEKIVAAEEYEKTKRQITLLTARDPYFIGTFPRSGTWMLKYFLHFLDHYLQDENKPDISKIYQSATSDNHYALLFQALADRPQRLSISHWMCPGIFNLPVAKTSSFLELLRKLKCYDYQRQSSDDHEIFHPDSQKPRIAFIYRNPFDVYRSYADIYEQRVALKDRQPYPFNPMTPFATDLMNAESDKPFEHFIASFRESNFAEFFAAYFMSFLLIQDAYPERVRIMSYENAMADRKKYLSELVEFGNIGSMSDETFSLAFDNAFAASDIKVMKQYEAELGHALSGAKTFYGETNKTHLSVKKRNWRDIFSTEDREFFCTKMREYEPRILDYLPELSRD